LKAFLRETLRATVDGSLPDGALTGLTLNMEFLGKFVKLIIRFDLFVQNTNI